MARFGLLLFVFGALTSSAAAQTRFDEEGESAMLARINQMRNAQSVAPLVRLEGLDAAAREHSADLAAHHQLAHVTDRTGDPGARVARAGVQVQRIAQNVARRATTLEAYQSILDSEANRAQLLDATLTHIGLAAAVGDDGVYVTQVLARIPPEAALSPVEPVPPPAIVDVPEPAPEVVPEAPPAAPEAPAPAPDTITPAAPAPAPGGPVVRVPATRAGRVAGYWVQYQGRWWYYPLPPDARPGQALQPDLSVTGPPPGMQGGAVVAPPPASGTWMLRPSPRRYFWQRPY